ncbi:hypothetical protein AALC17_17800 [Oscillospiraceae bacterium 38-13]
MVSPLSSRTGTSVKWEQGTKVQKAEKKTAESAMTDGFIERIKAYAKEDAKKRRLEIKLIQAIVTTS